MEHLEFNCDCVNLPKVPCDMVIAMAYVPWQKFQNVYSIQDGCFVCGTIFKELDKPFLGRRR